MFVALDVSLLLRVAEEECSVVVERTCSVVACNCCMCGEA